MSSLVDFTSLNNRFYLQDERITNNLWRHNNCFLSFEITKELWWIPIYLGYTINRIEVFLIKQGWQGWRVLDLESEVVKFYSHCIFILLQLDTSILHQFYFKVALQIVCINFCQLATTPNLFPLEVVQKYEHYQFCVLLENLSLITEKLHNITVSCRTFCLSDFLYRPIICEENWESTWQIATTETTSTASLCDSNLAIQ